MHSSNKTQDIDEALWQEALELVRLETESRQEEANQNPSNKDLSRRAFAARSDQHQQALEAAEVFFAASQAIPRTSKTRIWKMRRQLEIVGARAMQAPGQVISAGVACALMLTLWFVLPTSQPEPTPGAVASSVETLTFATGWNQREELSLADGSTIWMDWRTELQVELHEDHRSVRLIRGAAGFKVAPDMSRPFFVAAHGVKIKVTGTEFYVRSHSPQATAIDVLEGSVEVTSDEQLIPLQRNQRLVITGETQRLTELAATEIGRWREGMLVFTGRPLEEVIGILDAYVPYEVRLAPAVAEQNRMVTGVYFTDRAEQALRSIVTSHSLAAESKGSEVLVKPAKIQRPR